MEKLRLEIWRPSLKRLQDQLGSISLPDIIAGLLILLISVIISEIIKRGQIDRTQNLVETYADELSARIEEKLNTRFSILKLIQGYWQSDAVVTPHHFSNIAMEATKSFSDIQALNWVNADGVITIVTPLEGNEGAIGLNLNDLFEPAKVLAASRDTGTLQITPPIKLAQGGTGIVGYAPVFKGSTLMGYVSVVFRTDLLLDQLNLDETNFMFQISDGDRPIYGYEELPFDEISAEREITLAERKWNIIAVPTQAVVLESESNIDEAIILASLALSIILAFALNQAHQSKQLLKDREERFSLAIDGASDGLFDVNVETGKVYYSPRWYRMIGYEPGEITMSETEFYNRLHPDDVKRVYTIEQLKEIEDTQYDIEFRLRHKNGNWINILSRAKIIRKNGKVIRMVGTHVDLTELRKQQEKLQKAAVTDPLTGLRNRLGLTDYLDKISRSLKGTERLCVIHVDLDHFKSINDRYGYEFGDEALKLIAQRLKNSPSQFDLVARIGGDEFLIIWSTHLNDQEISEVADSLLENIGRNFWHKDQKIWPSACLGITIYRNDQNVPSTEIAPNAAIAVKDAKSKGQGKYSFYRKSMRELRLKDVEISERISNGLKNAEFKAFFQPQIDLQSSRILGFEALARWQQQDGHIVPAREFIPVAEKFYLVDEIDEQIFIQSCEAIKTLDELGFVDATISVNVSTARLMKPFLAEHLLVIMKEANVDPRRLRIEILESTLLDEVNTVADININNLVDLGLQIDLDDFGTGYSAISSLQKFPISRVKIDRSFVKDIHINSSLQILGKSLIDLLKNLQIKTLVEGIEKTEELDFYRKVGCDEAQGFLLGVPVSISELKKIKSQFKR